MRETIRAACVQLRSSDDVQENLRTASAFIREAHAKGARFIGTPENTCLMAPDGGAKLEKSFSEDKDHALPSFQRLAEDLGIWLLIGSLAIKVSEKKTANRSFFIGPDGRILARYDKIHLFDVNLPSGESYRESNTVAPGNRLILVSPPWGKVGMTVCYDLRFPHLYRALAKAGADIITVPAAWTETTGKVHWQTLIRARAIETGCFIFAPTQGGLHANGRRTYGHSTIIAPWGDVLVEGGTEPGILVADLDLTKVVEARARIPSLQHGRDFIE
ncbi:MAG: carbon-nitrogen hydrolase family protein [Alphaproteobacteria bacterium]